MSDLTEDTPGRTAIVCMESIQKEIVFKKPKDVVRRRTKQKILDEDTYVENIGKIIQRDFFPDLEKLQAQNEYLEAMNKHDTSKLRELYMKYSGKRPQMDRIPSPATFETPIRQPESSGLPDVASTDGATAKTDVRVTLDQYLAGHTSQDNDSFNEILLKADKKHREKYSYLYLEEERSSAEFAKLLALPSVEEQAALPVKRLNVDTWTYKNRNYIMFVPDGVELTKEQELEMAQRRQEIVHTNTRLSENPFNDSRSKETISEMAKTQAKVLDGKIGMDGKEILRLDTPKVGGYSFMRTPSPSPSRMESPLMTWGEIEGTPFRLDGGGTPIPRAHGPSFKMSEPPRRERLAIALAEKVSNKNKDQRRKAAEAAKRHYSPSPNRPGTIDRLASMSPAALRLASSRMKSGVGSDLRSSYSPSPRSERPKTPRTPRAATPKASLDVRRVVHVSTDDLLKLNVPKRSKASDFF